MRREYRQAGDLHADSLAYGEGQWPARTFRTEFPPERIELTGQTDRQTWLTGQMDRQTWLTGQTDRQTRSDVTKQMHSCVR
jgi:hypothetical protein